MAFASFSGTILYAGRKRHPIHGPIEVLGYQNTALNLASGPNAMLLHLPATGMSQGNFIPVGDASHVLTDLRDTVIPPPPFAPAPGGAVSRGGGSVVEVFDHDIYTVVLAPDAAQIPEALDRVPPHKRPPLNARLFEFYADVFARHTIALCCFDNRAARRAKPLLLWYRPFEPDLVVAPALDCHTGDVPDLDAYVDPDHCVIFGSDEVEGWRVRYSRPVDPALESYLPTSVIGMKFSYGPVPNGDYGIPYDALLRRDLTKIERVRPGR